MRDLLTERLARYAPSQLLVDHPEASILVPVTDNPDAPEILFTLRSSNLSTHSGQVAFPGGKRDAGDPSLVHTALREAHEEIGLPPEQVHIIAPLSQVVSRYGILVTPYVGVFPADQPLVPNPHEIDSIFRVPVDFFLEDKRERTDVLPFQDCTYHVPCYRWDRYQIWGLSAVVLVEFLNAVYDARIDLLNPQELPARRPDRRD